MRYWSVVAFALAACSSAPAPVPPEPSPPLEPAVPPGVEPIALRPTSAALRPVPIADIVSLSLGDEHACAVTGAGEVFCWGSGATFRLGSGLLESSKSPQLVAAVGSASKVAAGGGMSCAIERDGGVVCWGGHRQVAGDPDGMDWPLVRLPQRVAFPVAWTVAVSVGWTQATLLDAAGQVSILDAYLGPVPLPAFAPAKAIASFMDGFCALTREGGVQCVSSSESGNDGDGGGGAGYGVEPSTVLAPVAYSEQLRPMFFDESGEAKVTPCWRSEDETAPPLCASPMTGAVAIAAKGELACAVLGDGGLACWGCAGCWDDAKPPLGLPVGVFASVPFRIPGVSDVVDVAIGSRHVCTLHRDASVRCWGDDEEGQLGPAGRGTSATPIIVPGLGLVVALEASEFTTCALRKDKTAVCWGRVLGTYVPQREAAESDATEVGTAPAALVTERKVAPDLAPGDGRVCRSADVFDRNGAVDETTNRYDAKGHLVEERLARWDGAALVPAKTTTYTRDSKGNATTIAYSEVRPGGERYESSVRYRYDVRGNISWRKGKNRTDDSQIRYTWDALDRLTEIRADWGVRARLEWRAQANTDKRFAGLALFGAISDSDELPHEEPVTVRYATDAAGRRVYERNVDEDGDTIDVWREYSPAGELLVEREAQFMPPFYEDPIARWEYRYSYVDGRLVQTELYEVSADPTTRGDVLTLTTRTLHLYTGCL